MSEAKRTPRMRVLHASPKAPAVDLFIDDQPAFAGLAYGQISDYGPVSTERHHIQARPAGAGAQGRPLLDGHLAVLEEVEDYTLFLVGNARHLHTLLLNDTTSAPSEDHGKVRFVHASPDAPALDVGFRHGGMLFSEVAFDRATPFVEVQAGVYDVVLRPAGEAQDLFVLPDYTISAGNLYTFVAMGLIDGRPGFMVMPLVESFQMCLSAEPCF